jgi:hypothetical protein
MSRVGFKGALSIFVQLTPLCARVIVDRRNGEIDGDLAVEILCRGPLDKLPILDDVFN